MKAEEIINSVERNTNWEPVFIPSYDLGKIAELDELYRTMNSYLLRTRNVCFGRTQYSWRFMAQLNDKAVLFDGEDTIDFAGLIEWAFAQPRIDGGDDDNS